MAEPLLPDLARASEREALRFAGSRLSYRELAAVAGGLAARLRDSAPDSRVAVWATPTASTCVGVVAGLLAGVPVVPLNPKIGERELTHILADSAPRVILCGQSSALPEPLRGLRRIEVDPHADASRGRDVPVSEPDPASAAFVVYTSGTTGPPKGVLLPRRAIASNLDALADAWQWTGDDVVVHALPLFHVHGLIIGVLGPLRRGGSVRHHARFSVPAMAGDLAETGGVMFGVPTMYHRLATECAADPELAARIGRARLLVSGSAALPATVHERIAASTGQRVVERYGLTETLMNTAVRADGPRRAGTVGPPLPGVQLRLVDDAGAPIDSADAQAVGEVEVRGPNLFLGYLNRLDATEKAFRDGWFRTGDMAVREPDGSLRIVGRRATDLIKSGGYKIGAGEIENALLEHPAVAEAAVTGEPDDDLGERVVAWVVPAGEPVPAAELTDHVARLLAPHKRPRIVRYLDALPRNEMGKVTKRALYD